MLRPIFGLSEPDLERELLRKGVDARLSQSEHCSDCGRVPLIGERVYRYDAVTSVCELCRGRRRERPESSQLVRHVERGFSVRVLDQRRAA